MLIQHPEVSMVLLLTHPEVSTVLLLTHPEGQQCAPFTPRGATVCTLHTQGGITGSFHTPRGRYNGLLSHTQRGNSVAYTHPAGQQCGIYTPREAKEEDYTHPGRLKRRIIPTWEAREASIPT